MQVPESQSREESLPKKEANSRKRRLRKKMTQKEEKERHNPKEMILLLNPAMAEDIISLEFSVNKAMSSFYCLSQFELVSTLMMK